MVIDFHTHVFPKKIAAATIKELEKASGLTAATNGCVDGLLSSMEQAGVDTSVIMPVVTSPRQFNGINRFAYGINEQYGFLDRVLERGLNTVRRLLRLGGSQALWQGGGGLWVWDYVEAFLVGENVYLDLAFVHQYITDEQVYRIVEAHGSDRILFATDSPWSGQRETIAWLQSSRLSDNEKEKICELNAMKLLGID